MLSAQCNGCGDHRLRGLLPDVLARLPGPRPTMRFLSVMTWRALVAQNCQFWRWWKQVLPILCSPRS